MPSNSWVERGAAPRIGGFEENGSEQRKGKKTSEAKGKKEKTVLAKGNP